MAVTKIYFDESGNTGTELLDPQQPYFTTGSTDIPEDEAAAIIRRCFRQHKGAELKSKDIFKRHQGRRARRHRSARGSRHRRPAHAGRRSPGRQRPR